LKSMKISPLAPKFPASVPALSGVRMATCAGIKYSGRSDLLLMVFDQPASVAGVFTRSKCSSAPVDWCRARLDSNGVPMARAVVVNAGNANAFTGKKGDEAARLTAIAAANACRCEPEDVYLASTGVIGEPLDAGAFLHQLEALANDAVEDHWLAAAETIMTTDTYAKVTSQRVDLGGVTITINGMAKGSGMIAPDMATMLSFLVSDMDVAPPVLQEILSSLVGETFNAVSVDSDTSTSDTLMLFATGGAGGKELKSKDDPRYDGFKEAVRLVMHDLAMQVIRDGEGATKHIEIQVSGAENDKAAKLIAFSIANSPLVKTAVAGEDANWGRVVMAVGKAGEEADRDKLSISFGGIRVAVAGERDPDYSEEEVSKTMRRNEILISVDVGIGDGTATVWGCDLTKEYVAINGDYRS